MMPTLIGLGEVDITPQIGVHKIGMLREIISESVLDPICARAAIIESGGGQVAFIALDTLSIRWTTTQDIRRRIHEATGFPAANIMVAASHNHAGPAVANVGDVKRDDEYIETMTQKIVEMFKAAYDTRIEAQIGFGKTFEFRLFHNRRIVMRDGLVRTQASFDNPDALYVEGPIDPEVAVTAFRANGKILGCIVNCACHPTHHGGSTEFSAGYPGALAREMAARGCPITVFLNGACGNIIYVDYTKVEPTPDEKELGRRLADYVERAMEGMSFRDDVKVSAASETVQLPFRQPSEEEIAGTIPGAQRFVDTKIYDRGMPALLEKIKRMGTQPAEVQVIGLDEYRFAGIPAEYFIQPALRIKEESHPSHALVVAHANGMVGYVPTKEAFRRGGYETTFAASSKLAPEAADMLAEAAVRLGRII